MAIGPGGTMRTGWHVLFWLCAAILFFTLMWLCWAIMPPFIVAIAIGYLLDPVANRLQKLGLSRLMATLLILVGFTVVVALVFILVIPVLAHQLVTFIAQLPDLINKLASLLQSMIDSVSSGYLAPILERFGLTPEKVGGVGNPSALVGDAARTAGAFLNSLLSRGMAVVSLFSLLVVLPVVAFYMLLDWNKMVATIDSLIPLRHRETAHQLGREIDHAIAGFLRGQSLVCLFLGTWYGLGLSLIGLNYGLLIGITGGFLSFIPYAGSLTVLIVSAIVALVQDWPHWHLFALAMIVVLVGQFLEANVLSPKLVGDKVGVHPVWLIFALLAFGELMGFVGLLIAVPLAAGTAVILRFAIKRYRASEFYLGMPAWLAGTPPEALAPKPLEEDV
jgi:predicted PurR-regulated permease PerM